MALPPTTNSLDALQRARLLKSTRKLTDVLGTTPHVLDTDLSLVLPGTAPAPSTTPVRQKRQGIQFYSSPNAASSTSFISLLEPDEFAADSCGKCRRQGSERSPVLKQTKRRKSMVDRPPLVLRLNPGLNSLSASADSPAQQSAPSYAIRLSVASVASPLSPVFSTPPPTGASSIISFDEHFPDKAESKIRRKRMVKLTRTLGENIPSELLLSQCSRGGRSLDEQQRNVRPKIAADDVANSSLVASHRARGDRRRSIGSLGSTHPFPIRTTSLARSASATVQKTQRYENLHHHRRADTEWNGEWNIEDAEKRAQALRNLRCR